MAILHLQEHSQRLAAIGHPGYSNQFAYAVLLRMERTGEEAPQAIAACYDERRRKAIVNRATARLEFMQATPACPFPFTR